MNYNPYAAPQAAPPPPGGFGPSAGGPQAWDVGEVLSTAFEAFKNNWAVLVGSFFVFGALLLPLGGLPYVLTYTHTLDKGLASGLVSISCSFANLLVQSFLRVGMVRIFLAVARGQRAEIGDLFSGASHFLPMFVVVFITALIEVVGCCSFGFIPVYMGLCFAEYFVVDQNMGPIDALSAAWRCAEGQRGQVFVYALVALLVYLAGAAFCGVGMLATAPIALLGFTIIYLRLTGRGNAPAAGGPGFGGPGGPGYGPQGGGPGYGPPGGGPGGPGFGSGGPFGGPGGGPGFGGPGGGPAGGGGYGPPGGGGGGGYGPAGGGGGGGYGGPPGGGGGGYGGPPGGFGGGPGGGRPPGY